MQPNEPNGITFRVKSYFVEIIEFLLKNYPDLNSHLNYSEIDILLDSLLEYISNNCFNSNRVRFDSKDIPLLHNVIKAIPYAFNDDSCYDSMKFIYNKIRNNKTSIQIRPSHSFENALKMLNPERYDRQVYNNFEFLDLFNQSLLEHINNLHLKNPYLLKLPKDKKFKINKCITYISSIPQEEIIHKVNDFFNEIISTNNGSIIEFLKSKNIQFTPKFVSASILQIILELFYDIDMTILDYATFHNLLGLSKNYFLYIKNYYKFVNIDQETYRKKVINYFDNYFPIISGNYAQHLDDKNKILFRTKFIDFYENLLEIVFDVPIDYINNLDDSTKQHYLNIYNIVKGKQFNINFIARNSIYRYFLPQYLSLMLIHFVSEHEDFKHFFTSFDFVSILNLNNFKLYILRVLFRYYYQTSFKCGQRNIIKTDSGFVQVLKDEIIKLYHLELYFILELYLMSNLNPIEFVRDLNLYKESHVGRFLAQLKKRPVFKGDTYDNYIEPFIRNTFEDSQEDLSKALFLMNKLKDLLHERFLHQGIYYHFIRSTFHFNSFKSRFPQSTFLRSLEENFDIIKEKRFPNDMFNNFANIRISLFTLKGNKTSEINKNTLNLFIDKLLKDNKITFYLKNESDFSFYKKRFPSLELNTNIFYNHELCEIVADVSNEYHESQISRKPYHPDICGNILIRNNDSVAIEFPVFIPYKDKRYFIGHIDLLRITDYKNRFFVRIDDFKQDYREILKSLPQISCYGLIFIILMKLYYDEDDFTVICTGFTKDIAIEFDPLIIYDILEFIQTLNSRRDYSSRLSGKGKYNEFDLENTISDLISIYEDILE